MPCGAWSWRSGAWAVVIHSVHPDSIPCRGAATANRREPLNGKARLPRHLSVVHRAGGLPVVLRAPAAAASNIINPGRRSTVGHAGIASIPGCDKVELTGNNQYAVAVAVKVGPVAAKFAGKITLTDENGGVSTVTIADVKQSNGVIHVVDAVLLPK